MKLYCFWTLIPNSHQTHQTYVKLNEVILRINQISKISTFIIIWVNSEIILFLNIDTKLSPNLTWGEITTQFSRPSGFRKYAHFLVKTCWHDRCDYHITRICFYNAPKGPIAHGQNLKNCQNLLGGGKFVGFRFWWKWHHRIRKMQEIEWWYF